VVDGITSDTGYPSQPQINSRITLVEAKDEKRFAVAAGTPASLIKPQMTGCKAAQIMLVSAMEVVARKEQGVVLERRGCNTVYNPVLCFHNTFCGLRFNLVWEPGYLRMAPKAGEKIGKFLAKLQISFL